jgi:hypothetical protein
VNKGIRLTPDLILFGDAALCLVLACCGVVRAQRYRDFTTRTPLGKGDTLVLGFMAGASPGTTTRGACGSWP